MELNLDIKRYICEFLNFDDILNFSISCKENYMLFDDKFYENLAYKYYGKCFWVKASYRNQNLSKPLKNFKLELIRIENFQKSLDKLNLSRWTKKDFYNYWRCF